jgi:hypothetical protein
MFFELKILMEDIMFNFFKGVKNIWKEKAKKRSQENKKLIKQIKRLKASRENWKKSAIKYKQLNENLNKELKKN